MHVFILVCVCVNVCVQVIVCVRVRVVSQCVVCVSVCVEKSWRSGLRSMCVCVCATLNPVASRVLQDAKERELPLEDTED